MNSDTAPRLRSFFDAKPLEYRKCQGFAPTASVTVQVVVMMMLRVI